MVGGGAMKSNEISEFIMDTIEDIVYVADPVTHSLYYLNGQGRRQFNLVEPEQWHRKKCYKILQGLDAPCPFCTNGHLTQNEFFNWEYFNPVVNKYFYIQDKFIQFNGILARLEIAKDITPLKVLEQELSVQLDKQRMLSQCIENLQSPLTPAQSIGELLRLISTFYDAERGYIFEVTEDHSSNNTYEWCADGVVPQIDLLQGIPAEYTLRWFEKFESEGGFFIDSITSEVDPNSAEYEILSSQGISSLITAPLRTANGNLIGFIGVDNPKKYTHDIGTMIDVTQFILDFFEKITLFDKLHKLSYGDALTGMKNRNSYSRALAVLKQEDRRSLGIIYVDINGLKIINDQCGHKIGDIYILSVSSDIQTLFPDLCYRIGGDEFVVLWPGVSEDVFKSKVSDLTQRLCVDQCSKASIGIAWSDNSQDIIHQIELADSTMYIQKQAHYATHGNECDMVPIESYLKRLESSGQCKSCNQEILKGLQAYEATLS